MTQAPNRATTAACGLRNLLPLAITVIAVGALALIGALVLGWNTPRPKRSPNWEGPALPRRVVVEPDANALTLFDYGAGDFTLEVLAVPLDGPDSGFFEYGLVYRAQDPTHYYAFTIGADGYYTVVRVDGEAVTPMVPWQQFPHIRRGRQSNRLLVTCAASSCAFRINDEYVTMVEDDTWLSGDIGLWARSFEEEAAVSFQGLRMWVPDR